jgi:hypothetical protein
MTAERFTPRQRAALQIFMRFGQTEDALCTGNRRQRLMFRLIPHRITARLLAPRIASKRVPNA